MASLIAFFLRRDENYIGGILKELEVGNTEIVARVIEKLTGADLFQIVPKHGYSKGYNACIAEAQEDQSSNARPELKDWLSSIENMTQSILATPITGEQCPW